MRKHGRGGIVKVGELFEVYLKRLRAPQGVVITSFQEILSDLLNTTVEKKHCSYNTTTRTLTIVAPGPLKSEILLKKKEILNHLKGRLGEGNAPKDLI
jgi:hypothetical protein